jgi:hypothetical protein
MFHWLKKLLTRDPIEPVVKPVELHTDRAWAMIRADMDRDR